jgi:hypothetical protein
MRLRKFAWLAVGLAFTACADDDATQPIEQPESGETTICVGKCDGVNTPDDQTTYVVDFERANAIWPAATPATKLSDLYTVAIGLPTGHKIQAATHMFGEPVAVLPYHDEDGASVVDASGTPIIQGDRELSYAFPPGAIGYAIKHHRPERRSLDFGALAAAGGSADALKEDMKLQDTHIELVVGVRRPLGGSGEMVDGVITLNNPQNYQQGRFGDAKYSMIFVRPKFPASVDVAAQLDYENNIRTMMLGFNAVSQFPGDYNGGDPLAAHSPDLVRDHVRQMVLSVAGEGEAQYAAQAFFRDQKNMIYCAELAHVSTSAGLLVPLNQAGLVDSGLVDQATFDRFKRLVEGHNEGLSTPFTQLNDNVYAKYVEATMAPGSLKSMAEITGESDRLAFRPQTMAEIVAGFLATHIPRADERLGGEALAPVQAAVLKAMQPGLYEAMGMDDGLFQSMVGNAQDRIASLQEDLADPELSEARRVSTTDAIAAEEVNLAQAQAQLAGMAQKRAIVDATFDSVLEVVGTQYENYEAFRTALAPVMAQARALTGPRGDDGNGFFVPPSALHLVALGCLDDVRCGGLIGLDYVGHGIHLSAVTINTPAPEPTTFAQVTIGDAMPKPTQDYNGDGSADPRKDEYVTLINGGTADANLSGWTVSDEVKVRYEFPEGTTLVAGDTLWVDGGGDGAHVASGGLGLNDNGDTVSLTDAEGNVMDVINWGRVAADETVFHETTER